MMNSLTSILILIFFNYTNNAPINKFGKADVTKYLMNYGHYKQNNLELLSNSDDNLKKAISSFQNFLNIPETGVLDNETKSWMSKPRCEKPDIYIETSNKKRKRFAKFDGWPQYILKFQVTNQPNNTMDFNPRQAIGIIARSLNDWSSVTNLRFQYSFQDPNVRISFVSADHGDGYPFDGPGGVLAHSFYPTDGRLHFDNSETWSDSIPQGYNLRYIATHELGHIIGLGHSANKNAVMFPYYRTFNEIGPNFGLDKDDIDGAQALYGAVSIFNGYK